MTERKLAELTGNILGEIKKSLKVFKPSKSLSMLTKLAEEEQKTHAAEIDLVISGGGMKGYFMTGCYDILAYELKRRNIKIARVAGASAGAWSGFLICTGMTTDFWIEIIMNLKG
jgi:predicted acylesterase/phospholipase RssA